MSHPLCQDIDAAGIGVTLCRDSAEPLLEVCDVSDLGEEGGLAMAALQGQSSATGQALGCA